MKKILPHELKIDTDNLAEIKTQILQLKLDFEEGFYVKFGEYQNDPNVKTLTRTEYDENVEKFFNSFIGCDFDSIISEFIKKKNGGFSRRAILVVAKCNNSYFFEDDFVPAWFRYEVCAICTNETTLKFEIKEKCTTKDKIGTKYE